MRLVAYSLPPAKTPLMGVVLGDCVAPLSTLEDFYQDVEGSLKTARSLSMGSLALSAVKLIPPVPATAKVICAAINYFAHGKESELAAPPYPNLFARWTATLVPDGTPIPVPKSEVGLNGALGLDWEVEAGVIIGSKASSVSKAEAGRHVLGYVVFNDVSARRAQSEAFQLPNGQWGLGKNPDNSGPIGSFIVTADEVEGKSLRLTTRLNGELMQSGQTGDMLFDVPTLIEFASLTVTLVPGDLIATGTPDGVGMMRKPPRFLQPGDVIEVELEGVGKVSNPIV